MDRLMLMAMGGYGDMGMMGGSTAGTGLIDSLKTKLSFLPGMGSDLGDCGAGDPGSHAGGLDRAARLLVRSSIPTRISRAS